MRKVRMNIEKAVATNADFANQTHDRTCKAIDHRTTKTQIIVQFDDGTEFRYRKTDEVLVAAPEQNAPLTGKPTTAGAVRGWNRY